jgi:hypothetical protein
MRGTIPPLPNMPSWRDGQFKKTQGQMYCYVFVGNHFFAPVSGKSLEHEVLKAANAVTF